MTNQDKPTWWIILPSETFIFVDSVHFLMVTPSSNVLFVGSVAVNSVFKDNIIKYSSITLNKLPGSDQRNYNKN